jgi:hexosaminidase
MRIFRLTTQIVIWTTLLSIYTSCNDAQSKLKTPEIIPIPQSQIVNNGKFILNNTIGISYPKEFKVSSDFIKTYIKDGSSIELGRSNDIEFIYDSQINNAEGYVLDVKPDKIEIRAKTDQGAFYAVQTLRQLLPPEFENGSYKLKQVEIPCVSISDAPQFKYRGMHLDVGRHMYSVDFIKKYIDALAMLKMNTFHWHLTEDQGWRIEIKKYPKLQEVAAFRDATLKGHYSDEPHQFDGKRYGGFYTQDEIKDIVAYAQARHVTVIPEIEMPGHSQAAIAAYPELGCSNEKVEVATKWGIFEDIYCTKDETFNFLEDVLDEVLELFPSNYIHIGGDEAPKIRWKTCNDCQHRIKTEGLKDEHELQNYFITRIEKYLNSKGRQIIGWDEILEGGLAPNATVMSWRGIHGAVDAAKQHHNVILTPGSHCYFDHYQSTNSSEPLAIGGFLPLDKVYSFNPIPEELTEEESEYVLGAQGNIWTEYIPTEAQVEYMAFPRILAMSEVVWSNPENKNYDDFVSRVENFNRRLDILDINYANHLYEVEGNLISENDKILYRLESLIKGKTKRYTLDESEPNINSETYSTPIVITKSVTLKAAVFNTEEKLGSVFSETINLHKAVGKQISINVDPHKSYLGSGAQGLINGISGSDKRNGDKEWLGFWGDDLEITIDFGEETEIESVETRFHNGQGQWIYAPEKVQVSIDNNLFKDYLVEKSNELLENFQVNFEGVKGRVITLKIPSYGIIPEGKQGAGQKAWTFIDEIIIN